MNHRKLFVHLIIFKVKFIASLIKISLVKQFSARYRIDRVALLNAAWLFLIWWQCQYGSSYYHGYSRESGCYDVFPDDLNRISLWYGVLRVTVACILNIVQNIQPTDPLGLVFCKASCKCIKDQRKTFETYFILNILRARIIFCHSNSLICFCTQWVLEGNLILKTTISLQMPYFTYFLFSIICSTSFSVKYMFYDLFDKEIVRYT